MPISPLNLALQVLFSLKAFEQSCLVIDFLVGHRNLLCKHDFENKKSCVSSYTTCTFNRLVISAKSWQFSCPFSFPQSTLSSSFGPGNLVVQKQTILLRKMYFVLRGFDSLTNPCSFRSGVFLCRQAKEQNYDTKR